MMTGERNEKSEVRKCRKCGKKIPYWQKVNGVYKNLKNRKFCLDCSPHNCHNTSKYDPVERKVEKYEDFSKDKKESGIIGMYYRGLKRRRELYQRLGGKCSRCGYCKCERALSFHHRARSDKLFNLGLNNLWSTPMDILIKEADKCDLVCMNCHHEIEDELSRKEENLVNKVNKKYGTNF